MNLDKVNMRLSALRDRAARYRRTGMVRMSISVDDVDMLLGLIDPTSVPPPPPSHRDPLVQHYVKDLHMQEDDAVRAVKAFRKALDNVRYLEDE